MSGKKLVKKVKKLRIPGVRFTKRKIAGIKTILKEYELGIRKADK